MDARKERGLQLPALILNAGRCRASTSMPSNISITWQAETLGQQTVTTKTETVKVTYKQNWPAYNAAQTEEKARFIVLLDALCKLIDQPLQGKGRPRLPLADMIFACVYKVYSCFSSRRFMTDLRGAEGQEHIYRAGH